MKRSWSSKETPNTFQNASDYKKQKKKNNPIPFYYTTHLEIRQGFCSKNFSYESVFNLLRFRGLFGIIFM